MRSCHCNEGWREVQGLSTCLVPNDQPLSAAILALLVPDLGSELHPSNIFITFALLYCTWWRHATFSALLPLCGGSPSVTGGFPSQGQVTRSFDGFFFRFLLAPQQTVKQNRDAGYLRRHRAHHELIQASGINFSFYVTKKLIPLACINSLPSNGANSNRCITPYDLPISTDYAESKLRYKFHMFLLCCMYTIGSNRDIPKVDQIAI